jgi:hypothetical protein
VTDDAESRVDGGADAERAAGGPGPVDSDAEAAPSGDAGGAFGDDAPSFEDLSLPQRVFVAAVQNPTRGVVIVGLLAFGFSFYVAFWLVFPSRRLHVRYRGGAGRDRRPRVPDLGPRLGVRSRSGTPSASRGAHGCGS